MSTLATRLDGGLATRYQIHRELGQGGMAVVFLAQDLRHDRQVALKVLKPEISAEIDGAEAEIDGWEAQREELERELATICRKIARKVAEGQEQTFHLHTGNVHRWLGIRKYLPEVEQQRDEIGDTVVVHCRTP